MVVGKVAAGVGGDGQGVVNGLGVKRPLGSGRAGLTDPLGKETLQGKSNINTYTFVPRNDVSRPSVNVNQ